MNAAALGKNTEKAGNSSTTRHSKYRLNMNVMLMIKYFSNVMQGKRKLCERPTRFFFFFFIKADLNSEIVLAIRKSVLFFCTFLVPHEGRCVKR